MFITGHQHLGWGTPGELPVFSPFREITYLSRYLNTLAAAEQLYDALYQWEKLGSLTVTSISLEFFRDFAANSKTGTYKSNSATYKLLTARIRRYADGYVRIVQKYTPSDGALSEQFSRDDGKPLSAVDLTWSYASFLTVIARRAGKVPTPWGESIGKTVPRTCATTSANGRYVPAIRPAVCTKPVPATVALTFNVLEATVFGQNVFVTGSLRQLGFFNESNSVPLSANTFTGPNPRWYATVNVPAGTKFDYRYFVKEADGTIKKERRQNRRYRVPRRDCDGDVWIFDEFKN